MGEPRLVVEGPAWAEDCSPSLGLRSFLVAASPETVQRVGTEEATLELLAQEGAGAFTVANQERFLTIMDKAAAMAGAAVEALTVREMEAQEASAAEGVGPQSVE